MEGDPQRQPLGTGKKACWLRRGRAQRFLASCLLQKLLGQVGHLVPGEVKTLGGQDSGSSQQRLLVFRSVF